MKLIELRLLFFLFCISTTVCSQQNLWIVCNDPGFEGEDFTVLQEAIDSADAGDIIYVCGSPFGYVGTTVNKKVHLIGSGFWKTENNIPEANLQRTELNQLGIIAGGDSSIIEGFYIHNPSAATPVLAINDADNVVIRYNHIDMNVEFQSNPSFPQTRPVNTFLYGNYISRGLSGVAISAKVYNNIIDGGFQFNGTIWNNSGANSNCELRNNSLVRSAGIQVDNCVFRNNIVRSGDVSFGNIVYEHNVIVDDEVLVNGILIDSLGSGNIDGIDINTVWNLSSPSPDGKYQLIGDALTNPAIDAGLNGEDCGAYGGPSPYRISGIVQIPSIDLMYIPLTGDTSNMLNVKIRAHSN